MAEGRDAPSPYIHKLAEGRDSRPRPPHQMVPPPILPNIFPHNRHFGGVLVSVFSRRSVPCLRRQLLLPPHLRQGELLPRPGCHFDPFSSFIPGHHCEPSLSSITGSHLLPSPQVCLQEKLFFKSPADIALKHLTHKSQARRRRRRMEGSPPHTSHGASPTASAPQVWRFQRAQSNLLLASHKEAGRHVLDPGNR